MSIASFDTSHGLVTWLGVGNVRGILRRNGLMSIPRREELLLRGGIIGGEIPPLQASVLPVSHGDTLYLATDGIGGEFEQDLLSPELPQRTAEVILSRYASGDDDALVLVARVMGNQQ